jgi:hypothetical protein
MGLTTHSNNLVQRHKGNAKTMLELGSQNTYFDSEPTGIAKQYYQSQGFDHVSVDLNAEYGSIAKDLSHLHDLGTYDLVTDFGTSEHVPDFYICWLNKHKACKIGGLIISENPKVNNWHGHGYHYVNMDFYSEFAKLAGYEILEIGEHAAMGNVTDGWNVYAVLRKTKARFPSREVFEGLPYQSSKKGVFNTSALDMVESVDRFPSDDEQPTETAKEVEQPKKKRGRPSNK